MAQCKDSDKLATILDLFDAAIDIFITALPRAPSAVQQGKDRTATSRKAPHRLRVVRLSSHVR